MKSYSFAEKNMRRMRMEVFNDLVKSFPFFFNNNFCYNLN